MTASPDRPRWARAGDRGAGIDPDRGDGALDALVARLDLAGKVRLLTGADVWTLPGEPTVGLAPVVTSDGPAGVRGEWWDERRPSLLLPNPAALAATWDEGALAEAGGLLGAQARDKGVHVLLAPTINLARSPLGGRVFEGFGEDPVLTARLAAAYVRGVQSRGVAATPKHYVANDSETERMTADVRVDERVLREVYLRPFEEVVAAGAWALMAAYNAVDGMTMTEHRVLLRDVLKGEWGFDGVVVSDWFAARSTEAAALGGLDLVMPGPWGPWGEALEAAVRDGRVPEEEVDEKVRRLLRLAARTGALGEAEEPAAQAPPGMAAQAPAAPTPPGTATQPPPGAAAQPRPGPAAHTPPDARARVRDLAARGMVVLANDGVLPLEPGRHARVALVGPAAVRLAVQGGGSAQVAPQRVGAVPDALATALGAETEVRVEPGCWPERLLPPLDPAVCTDPEDGTPGLRLEARDADGALLSSEHREASSLLLMGGALGTALPEGTRRLVLRAQVTPTESGAHEIAAAGLGAYELTVGSAQLSGEFTPGEGDAFESVMRPPEQRGTVELTAGEAVEAELRLDLPEGVPLASLRLGHHSPRPSEDEALAQAAAAAAEADVAVVCVGTTSEVESEGFDRDSLDLPGRQDDLVRRVAEANPRTVVVVNAGAPVHLPWADEVAGVVWAWLPGQEGAEALADALVGAVEPAGRLPVSIPAVGQADALPSVVPVDGRLDYDEGAAIGYRGYAARGAEPAFPFGHGLGYTAWAYEDVVVLPAGDGAVTVRVRVRNTGARAGREVVQAYLSGIGGDEPARLVGFAAVEAEPGEAVWAELPVARRELERWHTARRAWVPRKGPHRVQVGRSSADLRLELELALPYGPRRRPGLGEG